MQIRNTILEALEQRVLCQE